MDQQSKTFTLKIGGRAGQGVKSVGLMIAKLATRSGFYTYNYTEYPSLIKGGHNTVQVAVSSQEVACPVKTTNFLIALNQDTVDLHLEELELGSGILFDGDNVDVAKVTSNIRLYPIPLSKLAKEVGGLDLLINIVALGGMVAILGANFDLLKDLISEEFASKGPQIVESNLKAAQLGYDYSLKQFESNLQNGLQPKSDIEPKMVINGNDAVALGAIAGGLQFAAIYPMSPISGILHTLAAHQEEYGYIYKQPEDEIAAINMAIGASFAGARSMTATSGGGFCLMTEGLGLAGITETPVVIINGMRPGPATGLPTWSDQGDLQFVLHASQGEFPKIVLAAGDPKEAFEQTMLAFNLADKYQTPVVLLIDKNICEHEQGFPVFDVSSYQLDRGKFLTEKVEDYQRFALSEDGVSPRSIPGSGNYFIANSYAHDTTGFTTEDIDNRNQQMQKRMNKLQTCKKVDMPAPQLFGPEKAAVTLVSWGSNKGSILKALGELENVNFLYLNWINPFPKEEVQKILASAQYIIDIECNYSGQLADLIREKTGIEIKNRLLKNDGRPIFPEEIVEKVTHYLESHPDIIMVAEGAHPEIFPPVSVGVGMTQGEV